MADLLVIGGCAVAVAVGDFTLFMWREHRRRKATARILERHRLMERIAALTEQHRKVPCAMHTYCDVHDKEAIK
jgi:hypothetical protein